MAEPIKTSKMLFGKKAVLQYMDQGEYAVKSMIQKGLPVRIEDGRWSAYVDNLEVWIQRWTMVSYEGQELPEDSE